MNFRKITPITSSSTFLCDCCTLPFHPLNDHGFIGASALSYSSSKELTYCPMCFELEFSGTEIYALTNKTYQPDYFLQFINPKTFSLFDSIKPIATVALLRIFQAKDVKYIYQCNTSKNQAQYDIAKNEESIKNLLRNQQQIEAVFDNALAEFSEGSSADLLRAIKKKKINNIRSLPTLKRMESLILKGVFREEQIASAFNMHFKRP